VSEDGKYKGHSSETARDKRNKRFSKYNDHLNTRADKGKVSYGRQINRDNGFVYSFGGFMLACPIPTILRLYYSNLLDGRIISTMRVHPVYHQGSHQHQQRHRASA
jgi:hypothetical protein